MRYFLETSASIVGEKKWCEFVPLLLSFIDVLVDTHTRDASWRLIDIQRLPEWRNSMSTSFAICRASIRINTIVKRRRRRRRLWQQRRQRWCYCKIERQQFSRNGKRTVTLATKSLHSLITLYGYRLDSVTCFSWVSHTTKFVSRKITITNENDSGYVTRSATEPVRRSCSIHRSLT